MVNNKAKATIIRQMDVVEVHTILECSEKDIAKS